jgi:hypothetical protein
LTDLREIAEQEVAEALEGIALDAALGRKAAAMVQQLMIQAFMRGFSRATEQEDASNG